MAIHFFLQSTKSPSPIYIRIREGRDVDAKARTEYSVNPENWNQGEIKMLRMPKGATAEAKAELMEANKHLAKLEENLNFLKSKVTNALNNRASEDSINTTWLKNFLNPPADNNIVPTKLIEYFDYYIQLRSQVLLQQQLKNLV